MNFSLYGYCSDGHVCTITANKPEKQEQVLKSLYTVWLSFPWNICWYVLMSNMWMVQVINQPIKQAIRQISLLTSYGEACSNNPPFIGKFEFLQVPVPSGP